MSDESDFSAITDGLGALTNALELALAVLRVAILMKNVPVPPSPKFKIG
jgi:hypothetical protein